MLNETITSALGALVIDGLGLGVVVLDREYRVILWNGWMEKHSHIKADDILGQTILERFPDIGERNKDN